MDDQTWRRINMRKVAHLIGAEMLHNLYNRHWPRINSLRFRHTITNFKQGTVESFAPNNEWAYMQRWLSQKFLENDPVLIREIQNIMNPDYEFVHEIMKKVDTTDLESLSDQEVALLLIDIMDYPLGEIYKLNVVQIEYSLNFAIHKLLESYEPSTMERNELLARLIAPGELTVSQVEEIAFHKLLIRGKELGIVNPEESPEVMHMLAAHHEQYAPTHCAYGELPPVITDYLNKYKFLIGGDKPFLDEAQALDQVRKQKQQSDKMLAKLNNPTLTGLCGLMAKIGVFRDYNKAKLGETVIRRLQILDEIARRTNVARDDLNYYLMAEITTLLDTHEGVDMAVIDVRKADGVCFIRNEDVYPGVRPIAQTKRADATDEVKGICASPGHTKGVAKIVMSKDDISKVDPGDIMVAIGTDFDLLEIMNLSAGIITEEGGLLSHASVVSRELKKPCLIGVSDATKQLHDGDMLELDATGGVIRILKK
jgi:phosphohistidine swiveling domain-containing protein